MTKATTKAGDDSAEDEQDPGMTTSIDDEVESSAADDSTSGDGSATNVESGASTKQARRQLDWHRAVTYGVLPAIALLLFLGAGYLKWTDSTIRDAQIARVQSVQAARDGTVALLSYTPADVDQQLTAARDLLTGEFRNSYTDLTTNVVIPGAKQQQIKAVATVPAATSVSANADHAVAMVFVDQTTTAGAGAPSALASTIRVGLDKVNGRWLISQFDPV